MYTVDFQQVDFFSPKYILIIGFFFKFGKF